MQQFLTNGGLSKMLWIILTFILALGAIVIFFMQINGGQTPNPLVVSILSGILGHAFTVGGTILNAPHIGDPTTPGGSSVTTQ